MLTSVKVIMTESRNSVLTKFFVLGLVFLFGCEDASTEDEYEMITLDDVFVNEILSYIDQEIYLESKFVWDHSSNFIDISDTTLYANYLELSFESADDYITDERFHSQNRGNLFVVSDQLSKRIDESKVEQYYFDGDSLSNGEEQYALLGKIQFREHVVVTKERLADSIYIKQWNNVVYWSQTFEFLLIDIEE